MKNLKILSIVMAMLTIMACENIDENPSIEGTYLGKLSYSETLKGDQLNSTDGTAVVTINSDDNITVHCYGDELDTTFMLNYFVHDDSILVCLAGEAFEDRYGHRYGQGHMMGGMMNDRNEGETPWQHHMYDEHSEDDEHFGGFHTDHHTFNYSIETSHGFYHFDGTKD